MPVGKKKKPVKVSEQSRVVCFNLYQLSSIQQGIQAGHAAVDLVRKYTTGLSWEQTLEQRKQVAHWADNDKTLIVLNGGTSKMLAKIIRSIPKQLPFAIFKEPDLYNKVTSVAVLIPEDWNDPALPMRTKRKKKASYVDIKLTNFYDTMKKCPLAR